MHDLIVKNASIVDGSGAPSFIGNLTIDGDTIVSVGKVDGRAHREIDAGGLILSPAFIDMHTHADMGVLSLPTMPNYLLQGVATVVTGNCGLTLAPCNANHVQELREYLEPFLPDSFPAFEWNSFGEFLDRIEKTCPALNMIPLVGHGTLRIAVAGFENRACSDKELAAMQALLERCIEDGCHGLSTGLFYPPGSYADVTELDSLFEVLHRCNALYASHLRSEGRYLVESVSEALALGAKHRVSIELSHHKASPRPFWGKVETTLALVKDARTKGYDASVDAYPYDTSCTTVTALLPPEALEGGVADMLDKISSPRGRDMLSHLMLDSVKKLDFSILDVGWDSIFIISCPSNRSIEGVPLSSLVGDPPFRNQICQFLKWIASIKADALIGARSIAEDDIDTILSDPETIIASDSWVEDPTTPGKCHPRAFGTFPRLIGRYSGDRNLLSLEEAVRRITSLPARKLRLLDRGLVRPGMKADIAIFDRSRFKDRATYIEPKLPPDGLRFLIINGHIAVEEGKLTDSRHGRVIRRVRPERPSE